MTFSERFFIELSRKGCSTYANDEEILHAFQFIIQLNPSRSSILMTHARLEDRYVRELTIVDQEQCIPSLIFCFQYLSILKIFNSSFCQSREQLPADIARLGPQLTELEISDTKITHLPNEINQLTYLERLTISNTSLLELPDSIGDLPSLKFLYLTENNLSSLPKTLLNLPLRQLTLSENRNLRSIQSINGHPYLELLNTRQCPIDSIPQNLPRLVSLNMANNHLTNLHRIETLGAGSSEDKKLNFQGNKINVLTPSIASIPNLVQLNLANNHLTALPYNLFRIRTLKELNLVGNRFQPRDRIHIRQMKPNQTTIHI